jgi:heat-inducible transcriptional repressor
MQLDERKQLFLKLIVENYIATAEPIGSQFLVEKGRLDISGATARNEMHALEEEGYLTHPHTSAGRIPTEAGYRYYVEHIIEPTTLKKRVQTDLEKTVREHKEGSDTIKMIARYIADESNTAVLVALNTDSVYYTGISQLFQQVEFRDYAETISVSTIFDHCEDHVEDLYEATSQNPVRVLIGQENPLGTSCSAVLTRLSGERILTVLGPMRMDYAKNIAMSRFVRDLFM